MHSRIFELSHKPVKASDRMTDGNIPDWFFSSVCDYAVSSDQREQDIDWLTGYFRGLCSRDGSKLSFAPDIKEKCFRESYEAFKSAASALAETDYETFAGLKESTAFQLARFGLSDSYEDKFGFYIYTPESQTLQPLNAWLRNADTSKPFYVGGTIDYHC